MTCPNGFVSMDIMTLIWHQHHYVSISTQTLQIDFKVCNCKENYFLEEENHEKAVRSLNRKTKITTSKTITSQS